MEFLKNRLLKLQDRDRLLMRELNEIRDGVAFDHFDTRARLHVPLLEELSSVHGMGGKSWRKQFIHGLATLGDLAEPGFYPVSPGIAARISREQLIGTARGRVKFLKGDLDSNTLELWGEASVQVAKGWLGGPFGYNSECNLVSDVAPTAVNPARRSWAQQPGKLRAVDDLKRSFTNGAKALYAPINLPLCDHIVRLCEYRCFRGDSGPLAFAEAGHADHFQRPP